MDVRPASPIELSVRVSVFLSCPYMVMEHLKCGWSNQGTNFSTVFNLNTHTQLVATGVGRFLDYGDATTEDFFKKMSVIQQEGR